MPIHSGGQSRFKVKFSVVWSVHISLSIYGAIIFRNISLSVLKYAHLVIKCFTVSDSFWHKGHTSRTCLRILHVDKIFISILNLVNINRISGFSIVLRYALRWKLSRLSLNNTKWFSLLESLISDSNFCINWSFNLCLTTLWILFSSLVAETNVLIH